MHSVQKTVEIQQVLFAGSAAVNMQRLRLERRITESAFSLGGGRGDGVYSSAKKQQAVAGSGRQWLGGGGRGGGGGLAGLRLQHVVVGLFLRLWMSL